MFKLQLQLKKNTHNSQNILPKQKTQEVKTIPEKPINFQDKAFFEMKQTLGSTVDWLIMENQKIQCQYAHRPHLYQKYRGNENNFGWKNKTNKLMILNEMSRQTIQQIVKRCENDIQEIYCIDNLGSQSVKNSYQALMVFASVALAQKCFNYLRQIGLMSIFIEQVIILLSTTNIQGKILDSKIRQKKLDSQMQYQSKELKNKSQSIDLKDKCQRIEFKIDRKGRQKQSQLHYNEYIQLPSCIYCLMRIQEQVTRIDLSQQSRRLQNQQKCNIGCRVCRIINKIEQKQNIKCIKCNQFLDLWICMICGSIGCGRYKNADAYQHYQLYNHIVSLQLQTQRVWNYLSDRFDHRFIDKDQITLKFPNFKEDHQNQSIQAAFWDYCSLVSAELDKQRVYYNNLQKQNNDAFNSQIEKMDKILSKLETQKNQKIALIKKMKKKVKKGNSKLKELENSIADQQLLTESNQSYLKVEPQTKSQEIAVKEKILADLETEIEGVINIITQEG